MGKCVYISGWADDFLKKVSQCCSGLKGISLTRSFEASPTWNGKTDNEAISVKCWVWKEGWAA
jgi:hypothetical protein